MAKMTRDEIYAIWKAAEEEKAEAERKRVAAREKVKREEQKRLAAEEEARKRQADPPPRPKPELAYAEPRYSQFVRVRTDLIDQFYENTGELYDPHPKRGDPVEGDIAGVWKNPDDWGS
jgi:chemotaxis protein histidine kinase CheA